MKRKIIILTSIVFSAGIFVLLMSCGSSQESKIYLTSNGLDSWELPTGEWSECGNVAFKQGDRERLLPVPGKGMFTNGFDGDTDHLISKHEHGDIRAHIEFLVAENSNSGVYFQGRYEIQIYDSWNRQPGYAGNCTGGIYERWDENRNPKGFEGRNTALHSSYPAGFWQSFDVIFKAPVFDAEGNKILNAEFVKVLHNGLPAHENVSLTGPTRASLFDDEAALGPLMLQGDHGPVAYRNVWISGDLTENNLDWQPLFDGQTLTGWNARPGGKWEVKDGVIHGSSPASEKRHGILLSEKRYEDFTLSLKFKAIKGNSGLYFRVDTVNSEVAVNGFQAEIDEAKDIGGLYETGGRAWVVQPPAEVVSRYFKPQDWNEMVISARGKNILVFVNGSRTAALIHDKGRTSGHIGLQLHGNMEMDVQFKDIKIITF